MLKVFFLKKHAEQKRRSGKHRWQTEESTTTKAINLKTGNVPQKNENQRFATPRAIISLVNHLSMDQNPLGKCLLENRKNSWSQSIPSTDYAFQEKNVPLKQRALGHHHLILWWSYHQPSQKSWHYDVNIEHCPKLLKKILKPRRKQSNKFTMCGTTGLNSKNEILGHK